MVATQWIVKYREVPTVAVLELKLLQLDSKILVLYQPTPVRSSSNSQFGSWKCKAVSTTLDILECTDIQEREIGKN